MTAQNRRQFLEESMIAAAAAAVAASGPRDLLGEELPPSRSAIEQLGVAVVGVRGRGNSHIGFFAGRRDTRVLYVCDVDREIGWTRAKQVARRQGGLAPAFEEDMRRVLDDPRVDIVSIATPNHWHALGAIWSMQAGKDVYVEKPVSHNVQEGRRMVEAARRYQRICQSGMQARSSPAMISAMEYMRAGQIGQVALARAICYKHRTPIETASVCPIPEHINYDLWLGPAAAAPLTRRRFHHDWHWQWPYGNGDAGYQGVHQLDLCRWGLQLPAISQAVVSYGGRFALDAAEMTNTQVMLHDFGSKSIVFESRSLSSRPYRGAQVGVIFEGRDGYVVMTSYHSGAAFDAEGREIRRFGGPGGSELHFRNFLKAVRRRSCLELNADIEEGHVSSALCHTGNISYRLGNDVTFADASKSLAAFSSTDDAEETFERTQRHLREHGVDPDTATIRLGATLRCDPASETFLEHPRANCLLTRHYRRPFVVPAAGNV